MDCEKLMTLLASMTLLLVVMDTVTSYPAAETEAQEPRISLVKKERRHHVHRHRSASASYPSPSADEITTDVETVELDVPINLPSFDEMVKSVGGQQHSSSGLSLPRRRRHRRSVAWWLQAAMRMCDESRASSGGRGCKELNVHNGRVRVQVRMEQE